MKDEHLSFRTLSIKNISADFVPDEGSVCSSVAPRRPMDLDGSFDDPYLASKREVAKRLRRKSNRESTSFVFPNEWGKILDQTFDGFAAKGYSTERDGKENLEHTGATEALSVSSDSRERSRMNTSFPETSEFPLDYVVNDNNIESAQADGAYSCQYVQQPPITTRPTSSSSPQELMRIGAAQMEADDFVGAVQTFADAAILWRKRGKAVALARALDRQGSCLTTLEHHDLALDCFQEAFNLRYNHLGPWHIDTVDARRAMGKIYFMTCRYTEARNCFFEIFWVHKAIFGSDHMLVGISAHDVAKALAAEGLRKDAENFYHVALQTYHELNLDRATSIHLQLIKDMKENRMFIKMGR